MMYEDYGKLVFVLWIFLLISVIIRCLKNCKGYYGQYIEQGRQENNVFNISERVHGECWPTHDHHVSIDSFVYPPDYQAKDPRVAPPPYTEVDLPTYDEAISSSRIANSTGPVAVHQTQPRTETV